MKDIIIVSDAWRPQINGVVRVLETIIPLVEQKGYTVHMITPNLFWSVPLPFYREIHLSLFAKRKVRVMLLAHKTSAVHIATEGPLGFAARSICIKHNIPFTTSYHTHFQLHLEARIGRIFTRQVSRLLVWFHRPAARTMVVSESLERVLRDIGLQHIVIWPLGVDTELFVRNLVPPVEQLPKPVFVYFGRLATEKNVEEFLRSTLPGTKLVIGDGPDRPRLEKKYRDARFVGYKTGQDLVNWLSMCDVCVFPSRTETFGLVVVEALACGVPVAAHRVMGPVDILTDGVDGCMSENLQEAAMKCLALSRDDCRKTAGTYSWDTSAEAFLKNLEFSA